MFDAAEEIETSGLAGVPFDAHHFFCGLRLAGAHPIRTETYIGHNVDFDDHVAAEKLFAWAHANDPDRKLQKEYARQRWANRQPGDLVVLLG